MDTLDKEMIHVEGKLETDNTRWHRVTQHIQQIFKVLFLFRVFHIRLLNCT